MKTPELTPGEALGVRVGNFVENSIERQIVRSKKKAPYLTGDPVRHVWYRVAVPGGHYRGRIRVLYLYQKGDAKETLRLFVGRRSRLE